MSLKLPSEVKRGDAVKHTDYNDLIRFVKSLVLRKGRGYRVKHVEGGQLIDLVQRNQPVSGGGVVSVHPWRVTLSLDSETGEYTAAVMMGEVYAGLSQVELVPVMLDLGVVQDGDVVHLEYDYETADVISVKSVAGDMWERVDLVNGVAVRTRYPLARIEAVGDTAALSVAQMARNNLAEVVGCFNAVAARTFTPV